MKPLDLSVQGLAHIGDAVFELMIRTWLCTSGTSTAKVDADHTKFTRLMLQNNVVAASNYTVAAGSTIITLNEAYLRTFANGTYTFRAEFSDNTYANIPLIVSTTFGHVPQTGIADITGTVAVMWISILMTVSLSLYLYIHIKTRRKFTESISHHGR